MDTLKLETKFMRTIVGTAVAKVIRNKFKTDVNLKIHELEITHDDSGAVLNFSGTANISEQELKTLIATFL